MKDYLSHYHFLLFFNYYYFLDCAFGLSTTGTFWTMASNTDLPSVEEDPRRYCSRCNTLMSSIAFDKHTVCVGCRGFDCTESARCKECTNWSEDLMSKKERSVMLKKLSNM